MKVLVSGGAGWIGSFVELELKHRGHEVAIFDGIEDVTDQKTVDKAVSRADAVMHLAAILGTAETFGVERRVVQVNILGTLNVLDACERNNLPMVMIGTGHKGHPNPYAATKGCAEDLALGRARVKGQPVNIVRAFNAYGPGQKVCEPHGKAKVRKIIPSFVCRALTGMPVEVFGGKQLIDLVHVEDVAACLADALEPPYGCVLEAGTGVGISVRQCAEDVIAMCDSQSAVIVQEPRQGDSGAPVVATEPHCEHAWPYGMTETIDWYSQWLAR